MEELRDIKDIVEVQEYSLETLIGLIVLALVLLFFLMYVLKNRRRRRKRLSPKAVALQNLKNMNYDNTKEVVYAFSTDGFLWINEKNKEAFNTLEEALISYKYKKEVPPLDRVLAKRIKDFIKELK
ncbi:hypothetical protein KKC13_13215 [bacterium]|nr:hypothetical protein [bacterium]MBU1957705.1 hypothetical protein [bacterium]